MDDPDATPHQHDKSSLAQSQLPARAEGLSCKYVHTQEADCKEKAHSASVEDPISETQAAEKQALDQTVEMSIKPNNELRQSHLRLGNTDALHLQTDQETKTTLNCSQIVCNNTKLKPVSSCPTASNETNACLSTGSVRDLPTFCVAPESRLVAPESKTDGEQRKCGFDSYVDKQNVAAFCSSDDHVTFQVSVFPSSGACLLQSNCDSLCSNLTVPIQPCTIDNKPESQTHIVDTCKTTFSDVQHFSDSDGAVSVEPQTCDKIEVENDSQGSELLLQGGSGIELLDDPITVCASTDLQLPKITTEEPQDITLFNNLNSPFNPSDPGNAEANFANTLAPSDTESSVCDSGVDDAFASICSSLPLPLLTPPPSSPHKRKKREKKQFTESYSPSMKKKTAESNSPWQSSWELTEEEKSKRKSNPTRSNWSPTKLFDSLSSSWSESAWSPSVDMVHSMSSFSPGGTQDFFSSSPTDDFSASFSSSPFSSSSSSSSFFPSANHPASPNVSSSSAKKSTKELLEDPKLPQCVLERAPLIEDDNDDEDDIANQKFTETVSKASADHAAGSTQERERTLSEKCTSRELTPPESAQSEVTVAIQEAASASVLTPQQARVLVDALGTNDMVLLEKVLITIANAAAFTQSQVSASDALLLHVHFFTLII